MAEASARRRHALIARRPRAAVPPADRESIAPPLRRPYGWPLAIAEARVAARDAEREELWARAVASYPGHAAYQRRAGARHIPVMVLSRAPAR